MMATDLIPNIGDPLNRAGSALRRRTDPSWELPFVSMPWLRESKVFDQELPPVDLEERTGVYVVTAAVPGWKPDDVDIIYEPGMLMIEGRITAEDTAETGTAGVEVKEANGRRYHRREIVREAFRRTISLPGAVKIEQALAEFKDGLLTITLPKSEAVKTQQIKIIPKEAKEHL